MPFATILCRRRSRRMLGRLIRRTRLPHTPSAAAGVAVTAPPLALPPPPLPPRPPPRRPPPLPLPPVPLPRECRAPGPSLSLPLLLPPPAAVADPGPVSRAAADAVPPRSRLSATWTVASPTRTLPAATAARNAPGAENVANAKPRRRSCSMDATGPNSDSALRSAASVTPDFSCAFLMKARVADSSGSAACEAGPAAALELPVMRFDDGGCDGFVADDAAPVVAGVLDFAPDARP